MVDTTLRLYLVNPSDFLATFRLNPIRLLRLSLATFE
nr:MAG TPA: hypothetical protein [Siphoviridae sp. ctuK76]